MRMRTPVVVVMAALIGLTLVKPAQASLTTFNSFTGTVAVSTDGFGSVSQSGTISAVVPVGSTVLAAYLYTSTFFNSSHTGVGGTLAGSPVAYGAPVVNGTDCCQLASARADVTGIIKPLIDGGPGGTYNFAITETSSSQDGEALVVVYSNALLPDASVGILDGFSAVGGDNTAINFADPLHPGDAGFFAEMRIGDGFSCCSQKSTIAVNGTTITENAGNNDDGVGTISNGQLITVGGDDDPFSPFLPSYADDHERYNLVPQITDGDTAINIFTQNPSNDDNIFLAVFYVSGEAGFNAPPPNTNPIPEPSSLILLGSGLIGAVTKLRRKIIG